MAKTNGPNKSQAIRDYFKVNKKAKTSEVIDALAKKGITVTVGLVNNVKSKHNKRGRVVKRAVAQGNIGIPEIKAALALLKLTGNMAAASEALAAAQEIKEIV
jgi:hypothetical protein